MGMRERRSSSRKRRIRSPLALRGRASMWSRGMLTSRSVSRSNERAREAISPVFSCSAPALAASSTICCSSSVDRRASMKSVRVAEGAQHEVRGHREQLDDGPRHEREREQERFDITRAYGSLARSASDFGTSSPSTSVRYEIEHDDEHERDRARRGVPIQGTGARIGSRWCAIVRPPNAAEAVRPR